MSWLGLATQQDLVNTMEAASATATEAVDGWDRSAAGRHHGQTVVELAPDPKITPMMSFQWEQSCIQGAEAKPACRHGAESKHRAADRKEMRLD